MLHPFPHQGSGEPIVELKHVESGYEGHQILNNVDLKIMSGDFVGLLGPSGSGKTTLLNVMSGLDQPTSGNVILDDVNLSEITNQESLSIRRNKIGIVFQTFGLLSLLSAYENVELQLRIAGIKDPERDSYTKDA